MAINCYESNGSIGFFPTIAHHCLKRSTNVFNLYMLYIETPANLVLNLTNRILILSVTQNKFAGEKRISTKAPQ